MFSVNISVNAGHWLPLLLDVAAKSVGITAAALAALLSLRRASAATRHLVLLAGLGILLGLPTLMPLLPRQVLVRPLPAPRAVENITPITATPPPTMPTPILPAPTDLPAPKTLPVGSAPAAPLAVIASPALTPLVPDPPAPAEAPVPPEAPVIPPAWLVLGWLLGVLVCLGRALTIHARVWRLARRCPLLPPSLLVAATAEAGGFAALKTGPTGTPPMVWGWPRPALLLPPEAAGWPATRVQSVLLHEAAHVRRQDWLTQTVAQAACALYWFNPLVWLLAARLGAEAERACDDAVLLAGVSPTEYADSLLAVARSLSVGGAARRASLGAVTMARRSPVRGRLEAILDTRRPRRRATQGAAALALAVALAVAAPLASLRPAARADEVQMGQAAPAAGVPTETDIAKVQQHLEGLEKARVQYAATHPSTLSLTQTGYLDGLRGLTEHQRTMERLAATGTGVEKEKDSRRRAIPLKVLKEQDAWAAQVARNYRAMVKPRVDGLPAAQVTRETRMHNFDEAIALDKTRVEMMQMEHSLGYPLHIRPDNIIVMAHVALYWEKTGQMSRADSVHISLLQQKMGQKKRLGDTDIDSLIVILHKPSIAPNFNRSDVMQLFSVLPHSSAAQQQKMREAITPLLRSRSHWERDQVEQTLKKLGGDAPTQPTMQKAQAVPVAPQQAALLKTVALAPPAADAPAGQATPPPGVPTEADIAQLQQHLQGLEQERSDYVAAHPNTLTLAQTVLVDRLCGHLEENRYWEKRYAAEAAQAARKPIKHTQVTRVWVQAKSNKPNDKRDLRRSGMVVISGSESTAPVAIKRQRPVDLFLAQLRRGVNLLPQGQVAQETRKYGLDKAIALDETRIDIMKMEHSESYSLNLKPDEVVETANKGLDMEKTGQISRTDWVHLGLLDTKNSERKPITDADVDFILALLHAPSKPGGARVYALFTCGDLGLIYYPQRQKVREALIPFLTSTNYGERVTAKRALRGFKEETPTPPTPLKPSS